MKIYWTKEASLNIQEIEDFISHDNAIAAIKLVDKLIALTDELIDFPEIGRIVAEISINQIREILF